MHMTHDARTVGGSSHSPLPRRVFRFSGFQQGWRNERIGPRASVPGVLGPGCGEPSRARATLDLANRPRRHSCGKPKKRQTQSFGDSAHADRVRVGPERLCRSCGGRNPQASNDQMSGEMDSRLRGNDKPGRRFADQHEGTSEGAAPVSLPLLVSSSRTKMCRAARPGATCPSFGLRPVSVTAFYLGDLGKMT
jgi:hypothetical protein